MHKNIKSRKYIKDKYIKTGTLIRGKKMLKYTE